VRQFGGQELATLFPNDGAHREVMQSMTEEKQNQFEDVLHRLIAASTGIGVGHVTPENCMQSPTVHAIVTLVSRRIAISSLSIYRKSIGKNGLEVREKLPDHPVAKLLAYPNDIQSRVDYWQDAVSWYLRYGNYYAYKARGSTGPIRALQPMLPQGVTPKLDPNTWTLTYAWNSTAGTQDYPKSKIHHVRGMSRNGYVGDSPITDVKLTIALEIAAERFGASFFENGALPLLIFKYAQGNKGFKTQQEEKDFIASYQQAFSGERRHRSFLLPAGVDVGNPITIENDKAQMIETRRYQRTVIAAAFGVPVQLVGDLERAGLKTFEQMSQDFVVNVVMPIATTFESAMERDLLTDADVAGGVCMRFNMDSTLRADYKSRQDGLNVQRQAGVINADEWREMEGMNPLPPGNGGDTYIYPANMNIAGQPPPAQTNPGAPSGPGTSPSASSNDY
jgi:HK97 family phage portal protein